MGTKQVKHLPSQVWSLATHMISWAYWSNSWVRTSRLAQKSKKFWAILEVGQFLVKIPFKVICLVNYVSLIFIRIQIVYMYLISIMIPILVNFTFIFSLVLIFFLIFCVPYLMTELRLNSQLCTQGSLLEVLEIQSGILGVELRWVKCKARALPIVLSFQLFVFLISLGSSL